MHLRVTVPSQRAGPLSPAGGADHCAGRPGESVLTRLSLSLPLRSPPSQPSWVPRGRGPLPHLGRALPPPDPPRAHASSSRAAGRSPHPPGDRILLGTLSAPPSHLSVTGSASLSPDAKCVPRAVPELGVGMTRGTGVRFPVGGESPLLAITHSPASECNPVPCQPLVCRYVRLPRGRPHGAGHEGSPGRPAQPGSRAGTEATSGACMSCMTDGPCAAGED